MKTSTLFYTANSTYINVFVIIILTMIYVEISDIAAT